MKWLLRSILVLLVLGMFSVSFVFAYGYNRYNSVPENTGVAEGELYEIKPGTGLRAISISDDETDNIVLVAAALIKGVEKKIKAGRYDVKGLTIAEMLDKFVRGEVVQFPVTVQEGLTSWQVVQKLKDADHLKGELSDVPAEGSLLPETYLAMDGETRDQMIERMQKAMTDTIEELWPKRVEGLPVKTKEEAVILASIVEKETAVADERKRVAGVFINRLNKGIALQTDPTVIYALTNGKIQDKGMGPLGRRLLTKDLEVDSPYNTYKYPGLPPGPIANPGRASIEAVLDPEEHEYIYFVADGTGGHVFAKTLAEHNENVAKWRKIRRQKKN